MKYSLYIGAMSLLAFSLASGQMVSSHAPSLPSSGASTAPHSSASTVGLQVTGKPVVRVNGVVLTDRDLMREMLDLFPYARIHNGFPKAQEPEIRQGAMEMIIFEELVYQDALQRRIVIAPERVNREELKFERQFGSKAEWEQYLASEMGGSKAKLKVQIKRSLLIEALLKIEVDQKSVVTASEARAYYNSHPKTFEHGEQFVIQTISIIPPPKANPETLKDARKRAESVQRQAKASPGYQEFGVLAEKVSDDDFHVNMGLRKAAERSQLPPEVVKVASALKPGQVSDLVQLGNAYTIIRLISHDAPGKVKFEDVRKGLTEHLQKEKYEKLRVALGKRLRQKAKIEKL